jgi:hypothetical protein
MPSRIGRSPTAVDLSPELDDPRAAQIINCAGPSLRKCSRLESYIAQRAAYAGA